MRAAIYLRISQDQAGESLGITRQKEDCVALADELGWEVVGTYTDNDVSATSGKTRPSYRRLLDDIRNGEVQAVIAWHPDRLYRRMVDLTELLEVVQKHETQIATVKAGKIDLGSATGQLLAEIMASVATYEGRAKSDRWRRSVRQRREQGHFAASGPRLYGWTRDGEVIDEEAEVIRWFAAETLDGVTRHALVNESVKRDLRTTQGNYWTTQSLRRLLINPRLAGHSVLNGQIVGTGQWTPILDPETWETLRAVVTTAGSDRGTQVRVALLAGMLYCGDCGAPCVTGSRTKRAGGSVRVYRCTRVPGRGGCGKVSAHAEPVEQIVESYAREWLESPELRQQIAVLKSNDGGKSAAEAAELAERILELEAQLEQPGVPVAALLRAIERARDRRADLLDQVVHSVATTLPPVGAPWPVDLDRRRRLVAVALQGKRAYLDRALTPGRFDPMRVRIEPFSEGGKP